MPFALGYPLLSLDLLGTKIDASVWKGIWKMAVEGYSYTAFMIFICAVLMPVSFAILVIMLQISKLLKIKPRNVLLFVGYIKPWVMFDVYLVALAVTMFKVREYATLEVDVYLIAFIFTALLTTLLFIKINLDDLWHDFYPEQKPVTAADLHAQGAMAALLKDALKPNIVQTLEGTAAFIHGGPFANIAHGCNSILATKLAMTFGDYVITEAGFGADLGAEKFYDIKCRKAGLNPKLTIIVATAQGLKMHGGVSLDQIKQPNIEGLQKGLANIDKHISNLQSFGQTVVVAFNRYANDTDEEIELVRRHCEDQLGVGFAVNNAFVEGGAGAVELANLVVDTIENKPSQPLHFAYEDCDSVEEKVSKVACNLYGAERVTYSTLAKKKLEMIRNLGYERFPVCIAKTQYSFSTDAKKYGVAKNFDMAVRDIVINAGAEMLVIVAGDIMRMPGLPKEPQALHIDIVNGEIEGLS